MTTRTSFHARRILAMTLLAVAACPLAAFAADVTVNYSIQVSAKNLDPRVEALKLNCAIYDVSGLQVLGKSDSNVSGGSEVSVAGSFSGTLTTKVTVPAAKVKDAKKWSCEASLRGPNGQYFTGNQDWGHLEGNDLKNGTTGNF